MAGFRTSAPLTALAALLFLGAGISVAGPVFAQEAAKRPACSAAPYRQFDFWLGDWDAYLAGKPDTPIARNRVTRILAGCVLLEEYENSSGLVGQSFSIFDASRNLWHQSWVTNRGELLVIEGGIRAGEMVLSGAERTPEGNRRQVRGTWKSVDGGVQETAVRSTDGGKTWAPWFDLVFRPHKP
jgi:hypothetical protein